MFFLVCVSVHQSKVLQRLHLPNAGVAETEKAAVETKFDAAFQLEHT